MNTARLRGLAWVSLVAVPLLLAVIELFHPWQFTADPGMSAFLSHPHDGGMPFNVIRYFGPDWWFLMHMIQTPLIVIIAFGLLLLTDAFGDTGAVRFNVVAWVSRIATVVFMTYYTVLDGIGGIGLGRQLVVVQEMTDAGTLTAQQADAVRLFLDRMWVDHWVGGVGSFISLTGSWAVLIAALSAGAYLLLNRKATWLEVALLAAFGWQLQIAHASYHGPLALALLASACALLLYRKRAGIVR